MAITGIQLQTANDYRFFQHRKRHRSNKIKLLQQIADNLEGKAIRVGIFGCFGKMFVS